MAEMTTQELIKDLRRKSKAETRRLIRDYRDQMPPDEVSKRSTRIYKRLFSLPEFADAHRVLFYMSFRNEPDTHKMIERSMQIGKNVNLPRIAVDKSDLDIYEIHNIEMDTVPGILGIIEPRHDAKKCEDISKIDLCIVPGIAFDRRGHRIGWGKGFYDRFLPKLSPRTKKFGLAYDFQLVDRITFHCKDFPLDGLITENEVLRFTSE